MASTITVSWSEIDTYRQCPFKHRLAYKERWQQDTKSPALNKGTLWHQVLEIHHTGLKVGIPHLEIVEQVRHFLVNETTQDPEYVDLIAWMYKGYVDFYGFDPDWRILAVEHAAEFWLPTDRGGRSRFKLKMKLDIIVKWAGRTWIVDNKSGKDLPNEKMLEFNDQFGLYCWGLRQMGKDVHGAIHSAARTQRNKSKPQPLDERFRRTPIYRTDRELHTIAVEAYKTVRQAYQNQDPQRHPDEDRCGWRCDYTEPCLASRKGDDVHELLADFGFQQNFERH